MDPANGQEALREIGEDIEEGADLIIAKPALAYMDIMKEASMKYNIPIVAYNVSGEYAMVKQLRPMDGSMRKDRYGKYGRIKTCWCKDDHYISCT